ncbi:hypothetical protein QTP88_005151 [Uroleucon formosanum]
MCECKDVHCAKQKLSRSGGYGNYGAYTVFLGRAARCTLLGGETPPSPALPPVARGLVLLLIFRRWLIDVGYLPAGHAFVNRTRRTPNRTMLKTLSQSIRATKNALSNNSVSLAHDFNIWTMSDPDDAGTLVISISRDKNIIQRCEILLCCRGERQKQGNLLKWVNRVCTLVRAEYI